jgi:hypothetical protein
MGLANAGGPAIHWRDEQIALFNQNLMLAHLGTWAGFKQAFSARFANPHKADKATNAILQGKIVQKTLVNKYNTQFNEVLTLLGMTGTDHVVLQAYETGLKQGIHSTSIGPLMAAPLISFAE